MARWAAQVKFSINPVLNYIGRPKSLGGEPASLTSAAWLVIDETREGVFLLRFGKNGDFAGDTWTPTRALALDVAEDEYGVASEGWIAIPDDVNDPIEFIRAKSTDRC